MTTAKKDRRVLVMLYTEFAGYMLAAARELVKRHNYTVHVVRLPVNPEAPFQFNDEEHIKYHERVELNNAQLLAKVKSFAPDRIVVSGWSDKGYIATCKHFVKDIPVACTFDNGWTGSMKQQLMRGTFRAILSRSFNTLWVPGAPQKEYADKMGIKQANIHQGWYTADTPLFNKYFDQYKEQKEADFPKIILYVGRYVKHKAIFEMWQSFIELQEEAPNDWELWCLGMGDQYDNKTEHPKIKHFGFVQPDEMGDIVAKSGVYILPSHFEPWGVTVHEFAASGFPLLISESVGAATKFVQNDKNGYTFNSTSNNSIKQAMKSMMAKDAQELVAFSKASHEIAQEVTPTKWADTVHGMSI